MVGDLAAAVEDGRIRERRGRAAARPRWAAPRAGFGRVGPGVVVVVAGQRVARVPLGAEGPLPLGLFPGRVVRVVGALVGGELGGIARVGPVVDRRPGRRRLGVGQARRAAGGVAALEVRLALGLQRLAAAAGGRSGSASPSARAGLGIDGRVDGGAGRRARRRGGRSLTSATRRKRRMAMPAMISAGTSPCASARSTKRAAPARPAARAPRSSHSARWTRRSRQASRGTAPAPAGPRPAGAAAPPAAGGRAPSMSRPNSLARCWTP